MDTSEIPLTSARLRLPATGRLYQPDARLWQGIPSLAWSAKTGYAVRAEPSIGWWVGWVELDDNVWFFAMNMDIPDAAGLPLRQAITKEVLKLEHVIP